MNSLEINIPVSTTVPIDRVQSDSLQVYTITECCIPLTVII